MLENLELATKGYITRLEGMILENRAKMESRMAKAIYNTMFGMVGAVAAIVPVSFDMLAYPPYI